MRLTNYFLKTNVMSNFQAEYFPLDGDGIIGGFDYLYTSEISKNISSPTDALILIWCII